jgi:hypothetical protein
VSDKNFKVKSGIQVPALSTAGPLVTDASGLLSSSATLSIAYGGTGQTTAQNARNAILPLQTNYTGYFLQTDQTNVSWAKVYNQVIQNAGIAVNPRGKLNIIGAVFADDAGNDLTTITFNNTAQVNTDVALSNAWWLGV